MNPANTYLKKLRSVAKQIELYDAFLQTATLNYNDRMNLVNEIARLNRTKKNLQSLPISYMDKDCGDYEIQINSTVNENRTKTKL